MMKKYRKIILINTVILLLLLAGMEIGCRVFAPEINLAGTTSDIFQDNRFKESPGFLPNAQGESFDKKISIDANGFIKTKCSTTPHQKKILFLGDSVTQGVGVHSDSSFVARLTCHFQDSIRIINSALIGYKLSDYKNVIESLLQEGNLNFQNVIINFCLNDIYEKGTKGVRVGGDYVLGRILNFFKSNSYFYAWLKNNTLDRSKDYFLYDSNFYTDQNKLKNLEKTITDIKHLCKSKQIQLSVVMYPYEYQLRKKSEEYFFPQKNIAEIFEDNEIQFYQPEKNLLKSISNKNAKELYLYGDGIHFSEKGHDIISNYLIKEVVSDF